MKHKQSFTGDIFDDLGGWGIWTQCYDLSSSKILVIALLWIIHTVTGTLFLGRHFLVDFLKKTISNTHEIPFPKLNQNNLNG